MLALQNFGNNLRHHVKQGQSNCINNVYSLAQAHPPLNPWPFQKKPGHTCSWKMPCLRANAAKCWGLQCPSMTCFHRLLSQSRTFCQTISECNCKPQTQTSSTVYPHNTQQGPVREGPPRPPNPPNPATPRLPASRRWRRCGSSPRRRTKCRSRSSAGAGPCCPGPWRPPRCPKKARARGGPGRRGGFQERRLGLAKGKLEGQGSRAHLV